MAPACRFYGSVWGGFRKGTVASAHLDARHFSFSLYATGAFQAATLLLELRGSESEWVHVWYVATLQGQACPWYSCRQQNIHRAVGMSGMPLFTGGRATRAASCVSICMSLTALALQHGTHCGSCPLACLSSSPQQGVPTCVSTRGKQSWQDARNYII